MTKQPVDHIAARELALFATNDADLYRQNAKPIMTNLAKKLCRGTYDAERAIDAWAHLTARAAVLYHKQFGGGFSPATRRLAAVHVAEHYDSEMRELASDVKHEAARAKHKAAFAAAASALYR